LDAVFGLNTFKKWRTNTFTKGCDYQADVCWEISNTIKQTSVGKCQILSSRRLSVGKSQMLGHLRREFRV